MWPDRERLTSGSRGCDVRGSNTCSSSSSSKGLMVRGKVLHGSPKDGAFTDRQTDRGKVREGCLLAAVTLRKSGWEQWQH